MCQTVLGAGGACNAPPDPLIGWTGEHLQIPICLLLASWELPHQCGRSRAPKCVKTALCTWRTGGDHRDVPLLRGWRLPSRTWNHWTSHWMKQLTWLRIIHSGEWCLRLVLCTHSDACQKRLYGWMDGWMDGWMNVYLQNVNTCFMISSTRGVFC